MRPKLADIALEKVDGFQGKRVLESLFILDLFGANDNVQCSALTRTDQILLDTDYTTGISSTIDPSDPLNATIAAGASAPGSERIAALYCSLCPKPSYVYAGYYGRAGVPQ